MPQLTIITINYNNATGLKKTMESMLVQKTQDFEYGVIESQAQIVQIIAWGLFKFPTIQQFNSRFLSGSTIKRFNIPTIQQFNN